MGPFARRFEEMDSSGDGKIERAMKRKRYEMRKKMKQWKQKQEQGMMQREP